MCHNQNIHKRHIICIAHMCKTHVKYAQYDAIALYNISRES